MKATQEKTIDDLMVSVSQLPAGKGWRLFMKLNKALLPAISNLIGSVKDWEKLEINGEGLKNSVETLLMELEPEKSEALIKEILQLTRVDGQEVAPNFDLLFQGRYLTMLKIVMFTLEVNYKSFLPVGGLEKIKAMGQKKILSDSLTH